VAVAFLLVLGASSGRSTSTRTVWPGATITVSDLTGASGYHGAVARAARAWSSVGAGIRFVVTTSPGAEVRVTYRRGACLSSRGASSSLGFVPGAYITLRSCPSVVRPLLVAHELGRVLGLPDDDRACSIMNSFGKSDGISFAIPGKCSQWAPPAWLPVLVDPSARVSLKQLYRSPAGVTDVLLDKSTVRLSWRLPPNAGAYRTLVLRGSPACPSALDAATGSGGVVYDERAFAGLHWTVDESLPQSRASYCYGIFTVSGHGRVTREPRFVTFVYDVPPVAAFAFAPAAPGAGQAVTFTDGSSDPDGTIVHWHWDFGDPAAGAANTVDTADPAVGRQPQHTFGQPGTYSVTLTVTDDGGKSATATAQVTVQ
jgi:hypothetical protein